jgi:hypothetical protein
VRRGASWTAAYHRQLTVAAVARPVRGGVGAPGVLAAERSWWLLAQTASAQRSVQPVSGGRASSPWSTRPAGTPRRRSPVSSRRCPPIRSRRPGSGCPAVRCPVTWGWSSRGPAVGRLLSSCPLSSCPVSIRAVSSRLVSALVGPDASVSSHAPAVAGGTRSRWPGDPGHREPVEARWLPGRRRLDRRSRRPRRGRCCRPRVGQGGPVATRAAGLGAGRGGRACPPSDQAGQAGVRGARRGRLRGGHEGQAAARGGGSRRVAAALGLGARPRWVVVAEADGRVGGPGGARRGADGDGCAAPSRPKPAASAPSSLPAAL